MHQQNASGSLGGLYDAGIIFPKDTAKAFELYQKSAAQGNADAQALLGGMYANGNGVPKDTEKAEELLQKAAAQGHAHAKVFLKALNYLKQ